MNAGTHRRWFRFSLRTMFVAMTLLCCWLGWQLSVVRDRQSALSQLRAQQFAFEIISADQFAAYFPSGTPPQPIATVPAVRGWLGDQAIQEIRYTPDNSVT